MKSPSNREKSCHPSSQHRNLKVCLYFDEDCGFCQLFFPIWNFIVDKMKHKCKFVKCKSTSKKFYHDMNRFQISSTPTVMFFKGNKPTGSQEGFCNSRQFFQMIKKFLTAK